MQKILIIQTAFIGDVVLATGIVEKLHKQNPSTSIDFLLRQGNEDLLSNHPFINEVMIWNKKANKYKHLLKLLKEIRAKKYDVVINVQRFAATGFLTAFSGAKKTIGFNKNPLSFLFTTKVKHVISTIENPLHEIERNQLLINSIASGEASKPKLYPSLNDYNFIAQFQKQKYICIAPSSVWFTKQFPINKWVELINHLPNDTNIYLLGAPNDEYLCNKIIEDSTHHLCTNLAGKLTFLQSTALQQHATMNYVNDSAPMHFASAVNAKVAAIYCSTLPSFGFGPLSDESHVIETAEILACRPCGLHGQKTCPLNHFNCAQSIKVEQLSNILLN